MTYCKAIRLSEQSFKLHSSRRHQLVRHSRLFRLVHYEFQTTVRSLLITAIRQEPTRHMETIFAKGGVGHQMYFVEGGEI